MTLKRLWQTLRLFTIRTGAARAEYIRKNHIFGAIGENCFIQHRKIPLYANLIRLGNNVAIASNVSFLTHDGVNIIAKNLEEIAAMGGMPERIGCIEIGDNVFIGSGVHILYDTKIGNNVIIGTCSTVTKDIPDNSVAVGSPAKVIGTFDDYMKNLMKEELYPEEMRPKGQTVSPELAEYMWKQFDKKHK